MSGILGQILSGVMGSGAQGAEPSAVSVIIRQILASSGDGSNGVAALVSRFQSAGLGQTAQSWVGTNANLPVSPQDLGKVFSAEEIQGWAQQAGTNPDAILKVLSEALPKAVDHVTPGGQMPAQGDELMSMLSSFLGSHGAKPTA